MTIKKHLILPTAGILAALAGAQTPPPPATKPAAAKPAPRPAAPKPSSQVDDVIKLVQGGMSEPFIIKSLKNANKPVALTPADMVKLKNANVSENIMSVMMDPKSVPEAVAPVAAAPVLAPMPAPAAEPAPVATPAPAAASLTPVSLPASNAAAARKRVIVDEFDYSTVMTGVQAVFGTQQNIGKGIRSMLTTRLAQNGKVVIVERAKIDLLTKEQDRNTGNRVKQGTGAKVGGISGADALLTGDIVIFGRDDKKKGVAAGGLIGGYCKLCGALANSKKEDKAVVAIDYRFIDAETSEVLASGEARGESKRTSTNWAAVASALGTGGGAAVDMTSSNFAQTIIGEATQDCVNKLAEIFATQADVMKKTVRSVEALVADVSGRTLMINAGSNDGVSAGETFEIFRIDGEVKDPVTKEVIDRKVTKVGDMTVTSVRDKSASGTYSGSPASVSFLARKKM